MTECRTLLCSAALVTEPCSRGVVSHMTRYAAPHLLLACLLVHAPRAVRAQDHSTPQDASRSVSLIAAVDVGTLPDAFTSRCARSLQGAPGTGFYFGARASRGALVGLVDTRLVWENAATGCDLSLRIFWIADNIGELRTMRFDGVPRVPFALSSARVGAQVQRGALRLAGTAGGGVVWSRRLVPLAVGAASASIGRGARSLLVEAELAQLHVRTSESRARFQISPQGETDLGTTVVDLVLRPTMFSVRAGIVWAVMQ